MAHSCVFVFTVYHGDSGSQLCVVFTVYHGDSGSQLCVVFTVYHGDSGSQLCVLLCIRATAQMCVCVHCVSGPQWLTAVCSLHIMVTVAHSCVVFTVYHGDSGSQLCVVFTVYQSHSGSQLCCVHCVSW